MIAWRSSVSTCWRTRSLVAACGGAVDPGQVFGRGADSRFGQRLGGDDGVEQSGLQRRAGVEQGARDRGAVERSRCQSVASQGDGKPGQGQPDPNLVQAELERTVGPMRMSADMRRKAPAGKGVARAGGDDRGGEGQDALGHGGAQPQQLTDVLGCVAQDAEVEAGGEAAWSAGEDDDGLVVLGLVEGLVQGPEHRRWTTH